MADISRKKVDESWKERVEREKQPAEDTTTTQQTQTPPSPQPTPAPVEQPAPAREQTREQAAAGELPEARFDLFISGLAMDALVSLGDVPHPVTKRQSANLAHARYLIELLGIVEEKTRGNLTVDEDRLLKDALYQLRMRYLNKTGG